MVITKVHANIVDVQHVSTSRNANPTRRMVADTGESWLTSVDSACGYAADNYRPHRHWGQTSIPVTLTLDNNRVVHIEGQDALDLHAAR